MNITDFKIQAHKICDRWYFQQTDKHLTIMERPYLKGPGFEKDYKVMSIPLEILCHADLASAKLTERLQQLKYMNWVRQNGKQMEAVDNVFKHNEKAQKMRDADFSRETKAFFRDARPAFKSMADETGVGSRMAAKDAIMKKNPNLSYDDAMKELKKYGRE